MQFGEQVLGETAFLRPVFFQFLHSTLLLQGRRWGGGSVRAVGWLSGVVPGVVGVGVLRHRRARRVCSHSDGSSMFLRSG